MINLNANEHVTLNSIDIYNAIMSKSLIDKIYFLDKVDVDLFIDFGCADGLLTGFISKIFPEIEIIGYDIKEAILPFLRNAVKKDFNLDLADRIHLLELVK